MEKLIEMKKSHYEEQLTNRIGYFRTHEIMHYKYARASESLADFVINLLPLFSILLIIFLEINRGSKMTVSTTFTIVSIISSMQRPLLNFVEVIDRYYMYKNSKTALNRMFFKIPDKVGQEFLQDNNV